MGSWSKRPVLALAAAAMLAATALPATAQSAGDPPIDLQTRVEEFVGLENGGVAAVTIRGGVTTTAAAGIANIEGDPMTVDTPMLVGGASIPMVYGLALQLVEEGLLDLDTLVTDHLPEAPVGEGATVRDLLANRHGIPSDLDWLWEEMLGEPDRTWTTDEMVAGIDGSSATPAGELTFGYVGTLVTLQLIEAITGVDVGTALHERITGPLGLDATVYPGGDVQPPTVTAGGWSAARGTGGLSYVTDDWESMRSQRPNVASAADVASFLSSYIDGQVITPELLEQTAWNEELEIVAYGLLRQDELFPTAGPLSARYFGLNQWEDSGVDYTIAGAPADGDVVVVMTNSWALKSRDLARDIVRSWSTDPLAAKSLSEGRMTVKFITGMACDEGRPVPFDLPPCETDGSTTYLPFEGATSYTGAFEGNGYMTGEMVMNTEELTFTFASRGEFMGEVEGCGYGTFYFEVLDGAGHFDDTASIVYTGGTATVLPGGTLPLAGTIDQTGVETQYADGTSTVEHTAYYTCDVAPEVEG